MYSNLKDREEQLRDGPSDELRAFVNEKKEMHRLEYWFMDWYDGAHVLLDEKKNAQMWNELAIMLEPQA